MFILLQPFWKIFQFLILEAHQTDSWNPPLPLYLIKKLTSTISFLLNNWKALRSCRKSILGKGAIIWLIQTLIMVVSYPTFKVFDAQQLMELAGLLRLILFKWHSVSLHRRRLREPICTGNNFCLIIPISNLYGSSYYILCYWDYLTLNDRIPFSLR